MLAEDDQMIGTYIRTSLQGEGDLVDMMQDGRAVSDVVLSEHVDLLLPDLGLPNRSGLDILKDVRAAGNGIPVIVITSRDGTEDRVTGLELDVRFNLHQRQIMKDREPVILSAKEYAVVEALIQRHGVILSRALLEERLYGWDEVVDSNDVLVHIHAARQKLGTDFIRTLRGEGYFAPNPGVRQ